LSVRPSERQAEPAERVPHRADARRHAELGQYPGAQFAQRGIRVGAYMGVDSRHGPELHHLGRGERNDGTARGGFDLGRDEPGVVQAVDGGGPHVLGQPTAP
jgi:hypothetical protein